MTENKKMRKNTKYIKASEETDSNLEINYNNFHLLMFNWGGEEYFRNNAKKLGNNISEYKVLVYDNDVGLGGNGSDIFLNAINEAQPIIEFTAKALTGGSNN